MRPSSASSRTSGRSRTHGHEQPHRLRPRSTCRAPPGHSVRGHALVHGSGRGDVATPGPPHLPERGSRVTTPLPGARPRWRRRTPDSFRHRPARGGSPIATAPAPRHARNRPGDPAPVRVDSRHGEDRANGRADELHRVARADRPWSVLPTTTTVPPVAVEGILDDQQERRRQGIHLRHLSSGRSRAERPSEATHMDGTDGTAGRPRGAGGTGSGRGRTAWRRP